MKVQLANMYPSWRKRALLKLMQKKAREERSISHLPPTMSYLPLYLTPTLNDISNAYVYAPEPLKFFYDFYNGRIDPKYAVHHWREEPNYTAVKLYWHLKSKILTKTRIYHSYRRYRGYFHRLKYIDKPIAFSNIIIDMTIFHSKTTCRIHFPDWLKVIHEFMELMPPYGKIWLINEYLPLKLRQTLIAHGFLPKAEGYFVKKPFKKQRHFFIGCY